MPKDNDILSLAEGMEALEEEIKKGPVQRSRRKRGRGLKEDWKATNIRMDPVVKAQVREVATSLGVPLEDVVHVAMVQLLERLAAGEIELRPRATATRMTLL